MLRTFKTVILPLTLLVLSGCATVKDQIKEHVQKPTADVKGVNITDMTLDSVSMLVDLNVNNPNSFGFNTTGFDLALAVEQTTLATLDKSDSPLSVPANGSAATSVPLTLKFADIYDAVANLKDKDEFNYGIDAGFKVALPVIGDMRIPVNFASSLPIPKRPEISFSDASLGKVGWTGAEMTLVLDVTNPNSFGIDLNKLSYQIVSAGQALGGGSVDAVSLKEGEKHQITIPVNLSFAKLGSSLVSMLKGSKAMDIDLKGSLDFAPDLGFWKPEPMDFSVKQALSK